MTLLFDHSTGLERIQREACVILADQLNDTIASIETAWNILDVDFNTRMGVSYPLVTVERVPVTNIIPGHRPSLINAPVDMYPNVSIMAFTSEPGGANEDIDFGYDTTATMFIEVMVKSGPYGRDDISGEGEYLTNCRINRTVDAIVEIFSSELSNQTLNGLIPRITEPPIAAISNVFTRTEEGRGVLAQGRYFFQGARLEYAIEKYIQAY